MHDGERALAAISRAFSLDTGDARVYFERDCLLRLLGVSPEERLADMRAQASNYCATLKKSTSTPNSSRCSICAAKAVRHTSAS